MTVESIQVEADPEINLDRAITTAGLGISIDDIARVLGV